MTASPKVPCLIRVVGQRKNGIDELLDKVLGVKPSLIASRATIAVTDENYFLKNDSPVFTDSDLIVFLSPRDDLGSRALDIHRRIRKSCTPPILLVVDQPSLTSPDGCIQFVDSIKETLKLVAYLAEERSRRALSKKVQLMAKKVRDDSATGNDKLSRLLSLSYAASLKKYFTEMQPQQPFETEIVKSIEESTKHQFREVIASKYPFWSDKKLEFSDLVAITPLLLFHRRVEKLLEELREKFSFLDGKRKELLSYLGYDLLPRKLFLVDSICGDTNPSNANLQGCATSDDNLTFVITEEFIGRVSTESLTVLGAFDVETILSSISEDDVLNLDEAVTPRKQLSLPDKHPLPHKITGLLESDIELFVCSYTSTFSRDSLKDSCLLFRHSNDLDKKVTTDIFKHLEMLEKAGEIQQGTAKRVEIGDDDEFNVLIWKLFLIKGFEFLSTGTTPFINGINLSTESEDELLKEIDLKGEQLDKYQIPDTEIKPPHTDELYKISKRYVELNPKYSEQKRKLEEISRKQKCAAPEIGWLVPAILEGCFDPKWVEESSSALLTMGKCKTKVWKDTLETFSYTINEFIKKADSVPIDHCGAFNEARALCKWLSDINNKVEKEINYMPQSSGIKHKLKKLFKPEKKRALLEIASCITNGAQAADRNAKKVSWKEIVCKYEIDLGERIESVRKSWWNEVAEKQKNERELAYCELKSWCENFDNEVANWLSQTSDWCNGAWLRERTGIASGFSIKVEEAEKKNITRISTCVDSIAEDFEQKINDAIKECDELRVLYCKKGKELIQNEIKKISLSLDDNKKKLTDLENNRKSEEEEMRSNLSISLDKLKKEMKEWEP